MKKIASFLTVILIALPMIAQVNSKVLPKVSVVGFNFDNRSFVSAYDPNSYFKELVGDTIIFRGNENRVDFILPDTIWIKKVKNPKLGKHYTVTNHYKTKDGDKTTPKEEIYDRPWVIKGSYKSTLRDPKYPYLSSLSTEYFYLLIEDVQTGIMVGWNYKWGKEYSKNIQVENVSKSHLYSQQIKNCTLYRRISNTSSFEEVSVGNVLLTLTSTGNSNDELSVNNTIVVNGKSYKISSSNPDMTLYTEDSKEKELSFMREKGRYIVALNKVIKPQNAQIRYGKMTTVTDQDKSVTKYSYVDNYISIIWLATDIGFNFCLENKSGNSLKVEWDESSYIDMNNSPSRIFHNGVKYVDRDKSQPPTVVPNETTLEDFILPSNLTEYKEKAFYSEDKEWISDPLIKNPDIYREELVGQTVKVLLPISVKGVINEYTYIFKIDWVWSHPELR